MVLKTRGDSGLKNGKELKRSTTVFKGRDSFLDAQKHAFRTRSYVFEVVEEVLDPNSRHREENFYGYGVPK